MKRVELIREYTVNSMNIDHMVEVLKGLQAKETALLANVKSLEEQLAFNKELYMIDYMNDYEFDCANIALLNALKTTKKIYQEVSESVTLLDWKVCTFWENEAN